MLIGYARVSTYDQNLEQQLKALEAAGCDRIFTDLESGAKDDRTGLTDALSHLRDGDTLVIWKLDRLGRSVAHLAQTLKDFQAKGIDLKSLTDGFDTETPGGKMMFHVLAAIAEFERDLVKQRTQAGLSTARARGRSGGRPKSLTPSQVAIGKKLAADKSIPVADICKQLGISRATYYREIAPKV